MIKRLIALMLIAVCATGQDVLQGLLAYKNANAWPTIREDDCILAYNFSDGTATDKSEGGHDGVLSNVTWIAATSTNSAYMDFAGTNTSFINVPSFTGSHSNLTVAFWLKLYDATHDTFFLGENGGFSLRAGMAGEQFYGYWKFGNFWLNYYVNDYVWRHIVFVLDKVNEKFYVYQNGLLTCNKDASAISYLDWSTFALGTISGRPTYPMYGAMSQVQMWDVALSSNESYQVSQEDVDGFPQP